MKRQHLFDSFVFNCHQIFYKCINPIASVDTLTIVDYRESYFGFCSESAISEFMHVALLIRRLQ